MELLTNGLKYLEDGGYKLWLVFTSVRKASYISVCVGLNFLTESMNLGLSNITAIILDKVAGLGFINLRM